MKSNFYFCLGVFESFPSFAGQFVFKFLFGPDHSAQKISHVSCFAASKSAQTHTWFATPRSCRPKIKSDTSITDGSTAASRPYEKRCEDQEMAHKHHRSRLSQNDIALCQVISKQIIVEHATWLHNRSPLHQVSQHAFWAPNGLENFHVGCKVYCISPLPATARLSSKASARATHAP